MEEEQREPSAGEITGSFPEGLCVFLAVGKARQVVLGLTDGAWRFRYRLSLSIKSVQMTPRKGCLMMHKDDQEKHTTRRLYSAMDRRNKSSPNAS